MAPSRLDRAKGCLVGLAVGDALGASVEFMTPDAIQKELGERRELSGEGWLRLQPGEVTDETSLARLMGECLIDRKGFEAEAFARRLVSWLDSSPRDVGKIEREAIQRIEAGVPILEAGSSAEGSAGNAPAVRGIPLGILYFRDLRRLREACFEQTLLTHQNEDAQWGSFLAALLVACFLDGKSREEARRIASVELRSASDSLRATIEGPIDLANPSSFVGDTLHAVLFDLFACEGFERTLTSTVNRGGDADASGALAGAIAGACYGWSSIPKRWSEGVQWSRELARLAEKLFESGARSS